MLKINFLFVFGFLALLVNVVGAQNNNGRNCPAAASFSGLECKEFPLKLDDVEIPIRVYTKGAQAALDRTFVVVHNNEQKGLNAVKEALKENNVNGRLVEVVSNYNEVFSQYGERLNFRDAENKGRYVHFGGGKYCVDPNRIYTDAGRKKALKDSDVGSNRGTPPVCPGTPSDPETLGKVKAFADKLMNIVTKNNTHKLIIGVHNNSNEGGLSLNSYAGGNNEADTAFGVFSVNTHDDEKVVDTDNFVLVSDIFLFVKISQLGMRFNIALQEDKKFLDKHDETDDGSMSIYFGRKVITVGRREIPFHYMNIEAEGKEDSDSTTENHKKRQKEMIAAVMKMKLAAMP